MGEAAVVATLLASSGQWLAERYWLQAEIGLTLGAFSRTLWDARANAGHRGPSHSPGACGIGSEPRENAEIHGVQGEETVPQQPVPEVTLGDAESGSISERCADEEVDGLKDWEGRQLFSVLGSVEILKYLRNMLGYVVKSISLVVYGFSNEF